MGASSPGLKEVTVALPMTVIKLHQVGTVVALKPDLQTFQADPGRVLGIVLRFDDLVDEA